MDNIYRPKYEVIILHINKLLLSIKNCKGGGMNGFQKDINNSKDNFSWIVMPCINNYSFQRRCSIQR